jgi:hypothetical protein
VVGVDLVAQRRNSVLAEEHRPIDFLVPLLAFFDLESKRFELWMKDRQDGVTRQTLGESFAADVCLTGSKSLHNACDESRWRFGSWVARKANG